LLFLSTPLALGIFRFALGGEAGLLGPEAILAARASQVKRVVPDDPGPIFAFMDWH
jgi:hypothetical protein